MQNHDSYRPQASVQYIFSIQELQMCKRHQVAYQLLIELHDYVILVVLNAQKHYLKTTNPQTTTLPHPPKKPNNKKKNQHQNNQIGGEAYAWDLGDLKGV